MPFYIINDRQTKSLMPGVSLRTFWGDKMLLAIAELEPQSVVLKHSHPHEQVGIVLEGELEFTIGSETRVIKPGNIFVIPSGIEHSAKVGSDFTRTLEIFCPVRDEYKW